MDFNVDNQQKSLSGSASNLTLSELLQKIQKIPKLNVSVKKGYSVGYENCEKQFKMDYAITFNDFDNEIWLVKSTSSIRTDRIYGNEFFAQNIKLVDKNVKKIFVVVPDSITEKELKNKNDYSNKIHSETYVSFLDDVLTFSELKDFVLNHASENLSQGISANILGNNAENSIVDLLTDKNNILLWNDYAKHSQTIKSSTYHWFSKILKVSGVSEQDTVLDIVATNSIPKLSNRGYPKTDVSFTITTEQEEITKNISVKNTSADTVTVHEGAVDDIILALNLDSSSSLANSLKEFQAYGSAKGLKESNEVAYNTLVDEIHKYNKELVNFFMFGVNSPLVNNPIQVADIMLYTKNFEVISRDLYVDEYIEKYSSKGQIGTPFKWTYPSKKRGQKVQIKGFTNNKK